MRHVLLAILLGWLAALSPALGAAHVVQKFDGVDANSATATFTVQDKWEVCWFCPRPINVSVLTPDGSVVAGVHSLFKGSLYVPKGGTYYLQLEAKNPGMQAPWHIVVAEVSSGTELDVSQVGMELGSPGDPNYAPPTSVLPPGSAGANTAGNSPANGAPNNPFGQPVSATPSAPVPPAPVTPPSTPAPTVPLTTDQARAVVLIKGDNAEGTGFLVRMADGPAVVTNIHVIANNPNLKVTTSTGELVKVLSEKAASDRDLALLSIQDYGFSYLQLAADVSKVVQTGDEVITPGNSEGGEVMLNTAGKVLGIGPQRVEIDNPIYHGNSGGPVFHSKSNSVLGVVTEAMKVNMSNDLDKASYASRNSAISGSMRYFALRLDTVPSWIPLDARQFQVEATFLDQFEEQSKRLDAYLNTSDKNQRGNQAGDDTNAKIYLQDGKIMKANNSFVEQASGADTAQRIEALRGLLFDLQGIADTNMTQMQNDGNFYPFDLDRVHDELDYRRALKAELSSIGNDIERLGHLPRIND